MPTAAANCTTCLRGSRQMQDPAGRRGSRAPGRAEIEAQDAVAVLHAGVVADHRGGTTRRICRRVGGFDRGFRTVGVGALGVGDRGIGLGDAVPRLSRSMAK